MELNPAWDFASGGSKQFLKRPRFINIVFSVVLLSLMLAIYFFREL